MSEKVVVPETRIKAVADRMQKVVHRDVVRDACNAFAADLSQHPIVPTDEWIIAHANRHPFTFITPMWEEWIKSFIYEWLARGLFRAPEPKADPEDQRYQQEMERLIGEGSFEMKAGFQRGWLAALKTSSPPEPEVPEAVKDLLERLEAARMGVAFQSAQAAILEAYRRGLRGK